MSMKATMLIHIEADKSEIDAIKSSIKDIKKSNIYKTKIIEPSPSHKFKM